MSDNPQEATREGRQRATALRSYIEAAKKADDLCTVRWHYKPDEWTPDTLFDLEGIGHLERVRETPKHIYVRVTPAGRDWLREYEGRERTAALLRGKSTREAVDDPAVRKAFGFTEPLPMTPEQEGARCVPGINLLDSYAILDRAAVNHKPVEFFALFSGGHDSLTAAAIAFKWAKYRGVKMTAAHIDTTIGIPETREFVEQTCEEQGWPLRVERGDRDYESLVTEYGFPGPGQHGLMYQRLKERGLRKLVRESKTEWQDRVMFVTGIRKQESTRRMAHQYEEQRDGATVWAAPIYKFSAVECARFIRSQGLKRNPVKDKIEMSGECLCGAFAHPGEMKDLELWFPETAQRIHDLEARVQERGLRADRWGHGGKLLNVHRDQMKMDVGPLCQSCELKEVA